jgi:WD40 repeat protein
VTRFRNKSEKVEKVTSRFPDVGDPLLHDDELCALVMSADGKYIATAGADAKIYLWSLDAALRNARVGVRTCITTVGDFSKAVLGHAQSVHDGIAEADPQLKASHLYLTRTPTVSHFYQGRTAPSTEVR